MTNLVEVIFETEAYLQRENIKLLKNFYTVCQVGDRDLSKRERQTRR